MERISDLIKYLVGPRIGPSFAQWPPDVFGVAAGILERSGEYLDVAREWPPQTYRPPKRWNSHIHNLGARWRKRAADRQSPPREIGRAWGDLLKQRNVALKAIGDPSLQMKSLRQSLLELLAAADEACEGAGIPGEGLDKFADQCLSLLLKQQSAGTSATLCKRILDSTLCVLPKLHTPQTGLTIRSLSHHVAAVFATEVKPNWIWIDYPPLGRDRHGLNVLVAPWPLDLAPMAFSPARPKKRSLRNLDRKFGFFDFEAHGGKPIDFDRLAKLVKEAKGVAGGVDMIVLPELALTKGDLPNVATFIRDLKPRPILISGLSLPVDGRENKCRNTSITIIPLKSGDRAFAFPQAKHHRWLLTGSQVRQYGLGCVLDPTVDWWEDIVLLPREVGFISLQPWLTLCTLICEDLARPDPIANVVRAVGPNLIIALLLDGPQIASRWSARYGTVLADDPGSSVLTVSSLGMVKLSRPPGKQRSTVVALWKDARSGDPVEIEFEKSQEAVLLCLTRDWRDEFTADGRSDRGSTSYLTLSGVHAISL